MSTSGKVSIITGASSGLGRAIAEEAIARGERVVVSGRRIEALADLVSQAPDRVLAQALDVTRSDAIDVAVKATLARFGRIDVVVNNAGYGLVGALEETSDRELRDAFESMFFGAVALTRAVIPSMREQKSGTIVQVTSMGGLTTAPGYGAYCAAKHALEGISECLSAELAPLGVRVLIVEPGAFRTQLFGGGFRAMPIIDAYAPTVGLTRDYAAKIDGKQEGDPTLAARAIVETVISGPVSLRLPLGADAVNAIRQKLASVATDVDRTESVATATAYPPA